MHDQVSLMMVWLWVKKGMLTLYRTIADLLHVLKSKDFVSGPRIRLLTRLAWTINALIRRTRLGQTNRLRIRINLAVEMDHTLRKSQFGDDGELPLKRKRQITGPKEVLTYIYSTEHIGSRTGSNSGIYKQDTPTSNTCQNDSFASTCLQIHSINI